MKALQLMAWFAFVGLTSCSGLRGPVRTGNPNLPFPTLGGMQFWADLWVHSGWRIQ